MGRKSCNSMRPKELKLFMDIAKRVAEMSYAKRKQVGAVAVKDGNILSISWNGTPAGTDNCCERIEYYDEIQGYHDDEIQINYPYANEHGFYKLVTKDIVIHAESNCLIKCAKEGRSTLGATLFLTLSPCISCAKMILQAGIKEVFYDEEYRDKTGIDFLNNHGIICIPIN